MMLKRGRLKQYFVCSENKNRHVTLFDTLGNLIEIPLSMLLIVPLDNVLL
jgi:hypothetical protein